MSGRRSTSWSISSLYPNGTPVVEYSGIRVSTSQFDVPVQLFWGQRRLSTNLIDYIDFKASSVNPKGKGGAAKSQKQYDYNATVLLGLGEGVIDAIIRCFVNGSTSTTASLSQLNASFFSGTSSQTAWSVVSSDPVYSSHAMAYRFTAYLGVPHLDLGFSPTVPDVQPEAQRANGFAYTHTTNGWINPTNNVQDTNSIDVLPSDCVFDLLANSRYGMGFASGDFTSNLSFYATYCRAQGIFFSPCLTNQEKATQIVDRWAQFSNSWIFWNGTQLDFCPLGDTALTANGVTYTPNNTPVASLGLSDFLGDTPITVTRKDPADCYNRTRLTFTDRTLGYISNDLEYKDQTLVDQFGLRDSASSNADEICDPPVANIVVQLVGKRAANIRNTYKFKTSFRQILLLPGDIVLLTEPNIGLSGTAVRITDVSEDEDCALEFDAEEYPGIVGHYAAVTGGVAGTTVVPDQLSLPSSVNTPAIVEPASSFTGGTPVVVIAASGTTNWGGCTVYVSHDAVNYQPIGEITAAAIQGTLTASLANHADPDTTNTLSVDTTESGIALPTSLVHGDADNDRSLCLIAAQPTLVSGAEVMPVNGELLSIGAVSATGTFTSNCTYLRRGQYGSAPAAHSSGDQFTMIDVLGVSGTSVTYVLPPQYVGQKIVFKLASFNQFHTADQSLAACTEYSYTPTGLGYGTATAGVPTTPTGLSALPIIGAVTLSWNANPTIDNVNAYIVYRATGSGASFSSASIIATVSALTWTDTTTSAGSYTYFLAASNDAGLSGHTSGVNATVTAFTAPTVTNSLGSISSPAEGDLAFLTTDGQLYRYHSGAWTVAVPAVNITGTIVNSQIAAGAIALTNFATSITPVQIVSSTGSIGSPTQGMVAFQTSDNQLYRYSGTAWTVAVPAANITGTIGTSQIAASAITSSLIATGAVITNSIASGAVTTTTIASGAITTPLLAAGAVTSSNIAANTITSGNIAASTITGGNIAASTITGSNIAAGTVTASNIAANTITAGQIAAGAIGATEIAAGAITASKLFIGAPGSVINSDPGPSDINAWTVSNVSLVGGVTGGPAGANVLRSSAGVLGQAQSALAPVDTSQSYLASVWWQGSATANGNFILWIAYYDASGAQLTSSQLVNVSNTTSWTFESVAFGAGTSFTAPSGAASMAILLYLNNGGTLGYQQAQAIAITQQVTGTLIQDGTVTSTNIAANTITGNKIAASTITSSNIAANAITAGQIAANAVTAGTIAAGAIDVGTEIVNNLIVTGHIQNGAVTTGLQLSASSVLLPSSGAQTTIVSGSFTASGNSVLILVSAHFNNDATFGLDIDGVTTGLTGITAGAFQLESQSYPNFPLFTALSAGSHTFNFWGEDTSGSGTTVTNTQLIVEDWQR